MRGAVATAAVAVALAAGAPVARAQPSPPPVVAIENATVHVAPDSVVVSGTVILRGGVIAAVGTTVAVPAGATRIDAKGKVVTAGFIDADTRIGLGEVDLEPDSRELSLPDAPDRAIHAAYRVTDAYDPASAYVAVARTGGVTSVLAVPQGGLVAGASAWVTLAAGATVEAVTLRSPAAMHVVLGRFALQPGSGSRGVALERLRELLDDARQYAGRRAAYERNQSRALAASRLDLEALQPVLRGELPLAVTVDRAGDIRALLALAREQRVRVIVLGGAEAHLVARELAAARVPVLVDPTRNLPESFDALRVRDDAAALLVDAGVVVAITTLGDAMNVRTLRQRAGIAVANGVPWFEALAAVTTAPAALLTSARCLPHVRTARAPRGCERGRLVAGAPADVVVWSGDPFELSSRPLHVFIGGVEQPLRTRQTLLLERYR